MLKMRGNETSLLLPRQFLRFFEFSSSLNEIKIIEFELLPQTDHHAIYCQQRASSAWLNWLILPHRILLIMSGKFVAGGTLDKLTDRDDAWLQAEQDLEDRRKERERNKAAHDGKTLFEVLQANKGISLGQIHISCIHH